MPEHLSPGYAAEVPRPPIGFSIAVPDHWSVLDLDPATREEWVDAFLDERLARRPRARQERADARRGLLELLATLQSGQIFMAAILAGEEQGMLLSASATLAWRQIDGNRAIPVEGLRQAYAQAPPSTGEDPAHRRVEAVRVSAGGAVKVVTRETMQVPMVAGPRPVDITQYFVPVLDTPWLAVITTTTGQPDLAPGVEQVADGMAESLAFNRRPAPQPPA